ncbi:MAG TPA: thiamine pyrophosphate-dependent dehydrogenase E1 component subunit alpha [Amycolatopsis sp.]|nr:thiamine pyrophosphate-dependent dehydrogenase E1 component subunit alpha [Amycolatopsis sp.]
MTVVQRDSGLDLYRTMSISRAIEQQCAELSGLWYPSIGEEAAVVGTHWCGEPGDVLYPHYRGSLVVQWMRGRSLEDIFRATLHREGSVSRGRHAPPFDGHAAGRVMPFASIMLGPNIGMAAGTALALKHRGERAIAICAFGDGTSGTGDFHETLNMASVLRLPTVFVCQNNQFSISTPASEALAASSIKDWASGYGMPATQVDGNDVVAVVEAVSAAVAHTRQERGPSFVELSTYRRTGHFAADPARYRDPEQLRQAEAADPITRFGQYLTSRLGVTAEELTSIADAAREQVTAALEAAKRDRELTADDLDLTGVYAR